MRALATGFCALLLLGCSAERAPRLALARPVRSEPLCGWNGARWEDGAVLLQRRTGLPLGRAVRLHGPDGWRGATVSGSLRAAGDVLVLEGRWMGGGLVLDAEVDLTTNAVLHAWAPVRLGAAGLAARGAPVRLLRAVEGRALVTPRAVVEPVFLPSEPPLAELECSQLSLHATPSQALEGRALVTTAGFPATAAERWLPSGFTVDAVDRPGGERVGRFVAGAGPLAGYVVAEHSGPSEPVEDSPSRRPVLDTHGQNGGRLARFAVPTADGVLWVGWVPADVLEAPAPADVLGGRDLSLSGRALPPAEPRSCDEVVALSLLRDEEPPVVIGELGVGARFTIDRVAGDWAEVRPLAGWFEPATGARLALPARQARACPRVGAGVED